MNGSEPTLDESVVDARARDPRQSLWASSRCFKGSPRSRKTLDHPVAERGSCVLVGPPGAGKTSLLGAFGRACDLNGSGEPRLDFVALSPLDSLIDQKFPVGRDKEASPPATVAPATYSLQLGVVEAGVSEDLEISILDTPGEQFFEPLTGSGGGTLERGSALTMLRATGAAKCLVICIDAARSPDRPRQEKLHKLIGHLLTDGEQRVRHLDEPPGEAGEGPLYRPPKQQLPFDRVLILLTKIDRVCQAASRQLKDADWRRLDPDLATVVPRYRNVGPRELADLLDPLRTMRERVSGLQNFAAALKPGCTLAVGMTSAWGIDPTPGGDGSVPSGRPRDVPYGVREALLFLASGTALDPIEEVRIEDFEAPQNAPKNELPIDNNEDPRPPGLQEIPPGRARMQLAEERRDPPPGLAATEPPEVTVYLKFPQEETERLRPSPLARLFGLDVYSDASLDRRAQVEMKFAARVLLGVYMFEFAAWSFLFNALFNSDILFVGPGTVAAVGVATLFAGSVFWFERQVLTADIRRMKRKWLVQLTRILFILVSALIVAQPLELLCFRLPILKRMHAEGVRQEAVTRINMMKDLEKEEKKAFEESPEPRLIEVRQELKDAKAIRDQASSLSAGASEQQSLLQREVARLLQELRSAKSRLVKAQDSEEGDTRIADLRKAQNDTEISYNNALNQLQSVQSDRGRNEENVRTARIRTNELEGEVATLEKKLREFKLRRGYLLEAAADSRIRLTAWIARLQTAEPGSVKEDWEGSNETTAEARAFWPRGWKGDFQFKKVQYNFFEQLGVLFDLALNRPPTWPEGSGPVQRRLKEDFSLGDTGGRKNSNVYLFSLVAIHLVAAFIPFLVFTVKWILMPKDLEDYYSAWHQAHRGERDAIRSLNVEEAVQRAIGKKPEKKAVLKVLRAMMTKVRSRLGSSRLSGSDQ